MAPKSLLAAAVMLASATGIAASDDDASTSIATIWCPEDYGMGMYNTYASVIAADATATTYSLQCVIRGSDPDPRDTGCSSWPSVTLTVGPSTVAIYASRTGSWDDTRAVLCDVGPSTAQCDFSLNGREAEAIAQTGRWPLDNINGTEFDWYSQAFTITGGLEKLSGPAASEGDNHVSATTTVSGAGEASSTPATTGSSPVVPGPGATSSGTTSSSSAAPTSGARSQLLTGGGVSRAVLVAAAAVAVWMQ
ncbi:hypothetical protein B0H66DRAFT_376657 [Apodospora peruviana]|uniref:Uncharacterized protein n=1 Tax=Apodospora peruviana TaxID=516989 RepID=A0AAE0HWS5_9PEZI|nr:hypothetical protein B0H66DRAFT_376657 [Apodospora peruviana]